MKTSVTSSDLKSSARGESIRGGCQGFTILELLTVLVVISLLATMVFGSYSALRDRARRGACVNNLVNLHVAMASYLTDNEGMWPQVPSNNLSDPNYAISWINVLRPYKLTEINWICPSVQAAIGLSYIKYPRLDYLATPFGTQARAAYQYATQPWFIERADIHGDGNLLIFANGAVKSVNDAARDAAQQSF